MRPTIGITSFPRTVETPIGQTLLQTVSQAYVESVERAGALPVLLPVLRPELAEEAISLIDGLIVTGGGDIQPSRYGAPLEAETWGVDPLRDIFESRILELAIEADLPLLATCRGMQLLNVVMGGSLVQHVVSLTGQEHFHTDRWSDGVHPVRVAPTSHLADAVGQVELTVNSVHHQAVDRVATGTRAVAWAEDETVEAIEIPGSPHVVAVQWHPELMKDHPEQQGLFVQLVSDASRLAERPDRGSPDPLTDSGSRE